MIALTRDRGALKTFLPCPFSLSPPPLVGKVHDMSTFVCACACCITGNPKMPAIPRALPEGCSPNGCPDVCERHFALQMRDHEQTLRSATTASAMGFPVNVIAGQCVVGVVVVCGCTELNEALQRWH